MKNSNVDVLIKEHSDFIGQILIARGLIGDHNKDKAELLVHGPIRNYAGIVHCLPATQDEYYSSEGGLFRFGLECAFHSYRSSSARIINSNLVETRIDSDMRWNHAAFLSGLYSEAIKTLSRINVYSIDGTPWHQGHDLFIDWMKGMKVASYQISWRQEPNEELATTVAARIIGQGVFGFLAAGEKNIITTFCDSLMNPNNTQNPLTGIVRAVRHKLIGRDIEQNAAKYGVRRYGMHLEPWLIDTFRYLYNTRKWTVNTERSAIWYGRDGVYITWPGSFGSLVEAFKETSVPFIPHGADGLISVLHDSRIITGDGNELVYKIRIRGESGKERANTAIRLANPDIVFYGKEYPDPLDYALEHGLDAGNSSMPDSVGESGGDGNDANKKSSVNNAAPNALAVDAVVPDSGNASIRPGKKHGSRNNQTGGSSRGSTAPKALNEHNEGGINLTEMFSTGAGDDALPSGKRDASDSDNNSGWSDARVFFEELDRHSFGKAVGGRPDAAPQVAENANVGVVSGMESPRGDGRAAVSGNDDGSAGETGALPINAHASQPEHVNAGEGPLNNNNHNGDAQEQPIPVSSIDANGGTDRPKKAAKPAGLELEYVIPGPRQATNGASGGDKARIDLSELFGNKG